MRCRRMRPALVTFLILVACGDDPTTPVDGLSEVEARNLAGALHALNSYVPEAGMRTCPAGGMRTGSVSQSTEGDAWVLGLTATHDVCRIRHQGRTWTLDGHLDGRIEYGLDPFGGIVYVTGDHTGAIEWRLGPRRGTCAVDLTSVGIEGTPDLALSGTVCGTAVALEVTVAPPG